MDSVVSLPRAGKYVFVVIIEIVECIVCTRVVDNTSAVKLISSKYNFVKRLRLRA